MDIELNIGSGSFNLVCNDIDIKYNKNDKAIYTNCRKKSVYHMIYPVVKGDIISINLETAEASIV